MCMVQSRYDFLVTPKHRPGPTRSGMILDLDIDLDLEFQFHSGHCGCSRLPWFSWADVSTFNASLAAATPTYPIDVKTFLRFFYFGHVFTFLTFLILSTFII